MCIQNGESALHAASLFGHLKVVKELVQAGAKVDLKNKVCSFVHCIALLPAVSFYLWIIMFVIRRWTGLEQIARKVIERAASAELYCSSIDWLLLKIHVLIEFYQLLSWSSLSN